MNNIDNFLLRFKSVCNAATALFADDDRKNEIQQKISAINNKYNHAIKIIFWKYIPKESLDSYSKTIQNFFNALVGEVADYLHSTPSEIVDAILTKEAHRVGSSLPEDFITTFQESPFKGIELTISRDKNRGLDLKNLAWIPSNLTSEVAVANLAEAVIKYKNVSISNLRCATPVPVKSINNYEQALAQTIKNILKLMDSRISGDSKVLFHSLLTTGLGSNVKNVIKQDPTDDDFKMFKMEKEAIEILNKCRESLCFEIEIEGQKTRCDSFLQKHAINTSNLKDCNLINRPINKLRYLGKSKEEQQSTDLGVLDLLNDIKIYLNKNILDTQPKLVESLEKLILDLKKNNNPAYRELYQTINTIEQHRKNLQSENLIPKPILDLLEVLKLYINLQFSWLSNSILTLDPDHTQLSLYIYEEIIADLIGIKTISHCKSGKDRTAIAITCFHAAIIFKERMLHYPDFSSKKNKVVFGEIAKILLESGHDVCVADQNAPGCKGLIKPEFNLPDYFKPDKKSMNSEIASLNKPFYTGKKLQLKRPVSAFFTDDKENKKNQSNNIINIKQPLEIKSLSNTDNNSSKRTSVFYVSNANEESTKNSEIKQNFPSIFIGNLLDEIKQENPQLFP